MEFSSRAAELTNLLESRISNFYMNFQLDEIGRVVSVGDGIARVYGLKEIQAGEMVEFASGVKGIALNLENVELFVCLFCCVILVRAFIIQIVIKHTMDRRSGRTRVSASSSSSSANSSNPKKKKDEEMLKIRHLAVISVQNFLDTYEQQILSTFPRTSSCLRTPAFLGGLVDGVLADADLCSDSEPMTLAELKAVHDNLVSAVERIEGFQNNDIYENLVNYISTLEKGR